jgi:PHD/YefM family antitoxin component YafN of YafNO toxin-antitoxin module
MASNDARSKFTEFLNSINKEPILVTKKQVPHGVFISVEQLEAIGWPKGVVIANAEGYLSALRSEELVDRLLNPEPDTEDEATISISEAAERWKFKRQQLKGKSAIRKRDAALAEDDIGETLKVKLSTAASEVLQKLNKMDGYTVAHRLVELAHDPDSQPTHIIRTGTSIWKCHVMFQFSVIFRAEYGLLRVPQIWKRDDIEAVLDAVLSP